MFHHLRKWSKTKLHNAGPLVTIIYRMTQSGLKAKLLLIYLQFTQRQKLNSLMLNSNNNDNGIKKIGLISKKKNNFAHVAHVFVHCFATVCQDYNMELPETSLQFIHVLLRKFTFFPLLLISTLVAISICHFLTATRTRSQWHAGLACLEIRLRNEEAINSTRNMIYFLKVFYFLLYRRQYFLFVSQLIQYTCQQLPKIPLLQQANACINTRKFKGLDSREIPSLPDIKKVIYTARHFNHRRK